MDRGYTVIRGSLFDFKLIKIKQIDSNFLVKSNIRFLKLCTFLRESKDDMYSGFKL